MPQVYSGRDVGKIIEPLLKNAFSRIWVCSPYISPEYARVLVEKAARGIDVRVITSNSSVNLKALNILHGGYRIRRSISLFHLILFLGLLFSGPTSMFLIYIVGGNAVLYTIIALWIIGTLLLPLIIGGRIFFFISLVIGFVVAVATKDINYGFLAYMVPAVLTAAYRFIVVYRYEAGKTNVNLLVVDSDRIVHSKIYIFDNIGITGSANLTRSGLWRNLETITIYRDGEVDFVINEFMKIWNSITGGSLYVEYSPLNWMY